MTFNTDEPIEIDADGLDDELDVIGVEDPPDADLVLD